MQKYTAIIWGAIGAILGSIGDVLILSAAKEGSCAQLKLCAGTFLYALCGIAWYMIIKSGDGSYSSSVAIWFSVGAIISVLIALYVQEKQTPLQWAGFGLIIVGIMVRSFSGLIK